MRTGLSNSIEGIFSKMHRNNKTMTDRHINLEQDIGQKDATFFRDDLWRFGAFQMSNFLDTNNFAVFGGGRGGTVGR